MKRLLSFGVALFIATTALWAYDFKDGEFGYRILNDNSVAVTTCRDSIGRNLVHATIPASVTHNDTTYIVTMIDIYAFHYCESLTSITIPNSITWIGRYAFSNCVSLTFITIPNSVTGIDLGAFEWCRSLTSITIPNSVTWIGEVVFRGCAGLTSIVVESGNAKYDSRNNCNAIVETTTNKLKVGCQNTIIPNDINSIGQSAFCGCCPTSVTIPSSVTSIGYSAFRGCKDLTSVTIGDSVTVISGYAFAYCRNLTSVTIPNSVTSIGLRAFESVPNIIYKGTATGAPWGAKSISK